MYLDIPKYFYIFCFEPKYFDNIEKDKLISNVKQDCIKWSVKLLLNNIDSKSIRDLAGLTHHCSFNEIHNIFIELLKEHKIKMPSKEDIYLQYALFICKETLKDKININLSLKILHELVLDDIVWDDLYIFYLLYHAKDSLQNSDVQFYLPEVDKNNIDPFTINTYKTWIEKHIE